MSWASAATYEWSTYCSPPYKGCCCSDIYLLDYLLINYRILINSLYIIIEKYTSIIHVGGSTYITFTPLLLGGLLSHIYYLECASISMRHITTYGGKYSKLRCSSVVYPLFRWYVVLHWWSNNCLSINAVTPTICRLYISEFSKSSGMLSYLICSIHIIQWVSITLTSLPVTSRF